MQFFARVEGRAVGHSGYLQQPFDGLANKVGIGLVVVGLTIGGEAAGLAWDRKSGQRLGLAVATPL